ncbi:hypothetical protein WJX74_009748 [Apatococcus lobatus]|uniref:ADP-ribosylhydrolase ARH3 n=1 Tax=Apatococcus lobatus TaxID=904363 RepID=A0AAW1RZ70_9CHLO
MQLAGRGSSSQTAQKLRGMKLPWSKSRPSYTETGDRQRPTGTESAQPEDPGLAAKLARAQGALMGVMVADAAGASLEILDRQPTAKEVEQACMLENGRFPAGGVSDDSELTLALALGLTEDPQAGPLLERCAKNYIKWRHVPPTSMGRATQNAFSADPAQRHQAAEMLARTAVLNAGSEANGALMRASPLGIALHNLKDDHIASIAGLDGPEPTGRGALWTPFPQALEQVLLLGGDTDTNAAICCGMLGALWGVQDIPGPMKAAVLSCEDWRPAWLMPRQVPELAKALLQLREAQLLSLS